MEAQSVSRSEGLANARAFRTQQRARRRLMHDPFPLPEGLYWGDAHRVGAN